MIAKKNLKQKNIITRLHFKGSWLTFWLNELGAKIIGISNNERSKPSNFEILQIKNKINHKVVDIKDLKKLKKIIIKFKPDYIFHLAAQALVKRSYKNPVDTFITNSIGTLNILDTLKSLKNKCTVILITSDKSYKNLEIQRGYKENDIIGVDPYSVSKGCAELIIQSYLNSFLQKKKYFYRSNGWKCYRWRRLVSR